MARRTPKKGAPKKLTRPRKRQAKPAKPARPTRSKLTGRFATESQRARDSLRELQKQAREERKEQYKRLAAPKPKYIDGRTGRYMKAPTGHKSPVDKALGKLTKAQVTKRTEDRLRILDNRELPHYDVKKVVPGIDRVSRKYLYHWRYEGLLGEDMARGTLRALIRYSEKDPFILSRVVIRTGWGKNENAVNSKNGYPQQVLTWLDDLLSRESVEEILGLNETGDTSHLRFEVIAITEIEMENNGGLPNNTKTSGSTRKNAKRAKKSRRHTRKTTRHVRAIQKHGKRSKRIGPTRKRDRKRSVKGSPRSGKRPKGNHQ